MKALVLAGWARARLRPLSHTAQRQLLPVANQPVLFLGLEAIRKAGISEAAIVVDRDDRVVREAVGTGATFGLDVSYIYQDTPRGLAHCVLIARDFLQDDDFLVHLADNVILRGFDGLLTDFRLRDRPDAMVMIGQAPGSGGHGVARVDGSGNVTGLAEGPGRAGEQALVGAYVFTPAIHQAILCTKPTWRREREITHAVSWLIGNGGTVLAHTADGYWRDTASVDDLLDCNREVLAGIEPVIRGDVDSGSELIGPVMVDAGASVRRSRVVGPAVIGVGATVVDSAIGPHTSIGADCDIQTSTIEASIVLQGASLRGVGPVRASVIGRDARVWAEPGGSRLVLGDHSQVSLQQCVHSGPQTEVAL
ncbi:MULTISPECIES: sugar phosphate nucleotidyltransferase [Streptosporangium]|uniref:Glucose-1-phosphate thymidylyltransferase n=1 Tax=Streptosporangium brasiliense TaxID=47480 RepID=A0ABT9QWP9_9ACTN|nr:sugar phosphate nucleotidyltransferase [Streptosporangium brasiliense]MDP9861398.1 glucose-1-phosphate thymidylyltransferase [Streptosporangium brasiliense]